MRTRFLTSARSDLRLLPLPLGLALNPTFSRNDAGFPEMANTWMWT